MGTVTIKEDHGKGLYTVTVKFDNKAVEVKKKTLKESLVGLDTLIAQSDAYIAQWNAYVLAWYNYYVAVVNSEPINDLSLLDLMKSTEKPQEEWFKARVIRDMEVHNNKIYQLRKISLQKEIDYLDKNCPESFDTTAWCVAYTEKLTGDMESIEIDYTTQRNSQWYGRFKYSSGIWLLEEKTAPKTILQHPLAGSPHSVWFNTCITPLLQRCKGRYRVATIIGIDYANNTCDLYFDFDRRGQGTTYQAGYGVDKFEAKLLDEMPIIPEFQLYGAQQLEYKKAEASYMGGAVETFLVDDKVIVDLHNGIGVPTVIGYYDNPRPGPQAFLVATNNGLFPEYWVHYGLAAIDLFGFCNSPDMVNNASSYTIAFGAGSPVATPDVGVWDHDNYFHITWIDGNSSIDIVNNINGTTTDELYRSINMTNGKQNVKKYANIQVFLGDTSEITIYKNGVEQTHVKIYPQGGGGLDTKTAMIIDQTGIPIFGELQDSSQKGYFKFTGSYVHDWTS